MRDFDAVIVGAIGAAVTAVVVYVAITLVADHVIDYREEPALHPKAYWVQNTDHGPERVYGYVKDAPADARSFSDRIPEEDGPAFDCLADGNKQCGPVKEVQP